MHPYRTSDKSDNIKLSLKTRVLSHRAFPAFVITVVPLLSAIVLYGTGVLGSAITHEHYSYTKTTILGGTIWLVGTFIGIVVFLVTERLYCAI